MLNVVFLYVKRFLFICYLIIENKVTVFFCLADDFCKFYDAMVEKYTLPRRDRHKYHRESKHSKAEVMMILIFFHDSGYPQTFRFYLDEVCKYLRHLFPKKWFCITVSLNWKKKLRFFWPCLSKSTYGKEANGTWI